MERILKYIGKWSIRRWFRLGIGVFLLVMAIGDGAWILIAIGSLLVLLPILNIGCGSAGCDGGGCDISETEEHPSSSRFRI